MCCESNETSELTRENMNGKIINKFASSPFLIPALMKKARDTAQIFTSMIIRRKMKNFPAFIWKPKTNKRQIVYTVLRQVHKCMCKVYFSSYTLPTL